MRHRTGGRNPRASSSRTSARPGTPPAQPNFPPFDTQPQTPEELFTGLARTVATSVVQQILGDDKEPKQSTLQYALPWAGYQSWRDARQRLLQFEGALGQRVRWVPFNDSDANDGPMSLNAYPGRAFIERVTNAGDANLEAKALMEAGPMPSSPGEAVVRWFNLGDDKLISGDDDVEQLAEETVRVIAWIGDANDTKNSVLDVRDFGIGLTAAEMPGTILSLNRGLKKSKPYLTGKHGQGASSTYQYSDLTLIASRKIGSKTVAFTLVEGQWDQENGVMAKTPTYRYLVVDGRIPEIVLSEQIFPVGTLVRHIGYTASGISSHLGENSLHGLLMRSLAEPLFPVWMELFELRTNSRSGGVQVFPGYRRYGRVIRGSVNVLKRAYKATLNADEEEIERQGTRILHQAAEYFQLPEWDFGGRIGTVALGRVRFNYWVADPHARRPSDTAVRSAENVLSSWVDPNKTVIMTLDGQTHAEESRAIVTGQHGAKLWAVGRYMVVQVDCNELDPRAKYEMFTSTREHAKETPVKRMILEELIRRLKLDTKLQELNVHLAAANITRTEENGAEISSLIKKYLKVAGISFEQITRKVKKWVDVEEDRPARALNKDLAPITSVEPPTFVRWRLAGSNGSTVKLHPGQKYSFVFETDAYPAYWNPADPMSSKIKVTAHGIRYLGGSGAMNGGRVRCHFECPVDAVPGTKGFAQVQLDYAFGQALTSVLQIEVSAKPEPQEKPRGKPNNREADDGGEKTKVIKVKIQKRDFTEVDIPVLRPIPVKRTDPAWNMLGWTIDPSKAGFSIRQVNQQIQLYYNAEFPPLLELQRRMSKRSLEDEFVRRYEMKLVLHTIFSLNYEIVDEDDLPTEQKGLVRNHLCATAESLALATKAELEIEAKIKSEDTAPLDSPAAEAGLQAAQEEAPLDLEFAGEST